MFQPLQECDARGNSENKDNKVQLLKWQMISEFTLRPKGTFFLEGTVFIDLNRDQLSHVSNMNYFQKVHSSIIFKNLGILYSNLEQTTSEFDSYDTIIPLLKMQDNRDLRELADTLQDQSQLTKINYNVKVQIKNIALYNSQIRSIIAQKRKEFDDLRNQKILQMPKHKFMSFVDVAYDYEAMEMKLTGEGMNESLIKLYGCDLESMQAISLRKGILNFEKYDSNWKLLNELLKQNLHAMKQEMFYETNISIITLDEILVNVDLKVSIYLCPTGDAIEGYFHPDYQKFTYDRGIVFFDHQITEFQVLKINAIRNKYIQGEPNAFDQTFYRPYLLPQSGQEQQYKLDKFTESIVQHIYQTIQDEQSAITAYKLQDKKSSIIPSSDNIIETFVDDVSYSVVCQNFLDKFYFNKPSSSETKTCSEQESAKICGIRLLNK